MIELVDVHKAYVLKGVRKPILRGFSFRFPPGRNIGIMGENGVGKSTLLRLIAGTEPPDGGEVRRTSKVSWPMGFSGGFNGTMTGIENARFVARIYGAPTEHVMDYVRRFSDLGPSLDLPIRTYSSGMKARLAFGLSLAIDFDYYLVDEITAVGDQTFKRKSRAAFRDKLDHARVIMVSHGASTIRQYCDCGLFMTRRGIFFYDDVEDLVADYQKVLAEAG